MTRPRILALFGTRVIFGCERDNIEALTALADQGCEVLCMVRHESWNDHIAAVLTAHGLSWRKVPYLDGWLPGWRIRTMLRNPVAFVVGNWRCLRIMREFRPTHIHTSNPFDILSFLPVLLIGRTPVIYRADDLPTRHRWIWRLLWRFIVARTHKFVAISQFVGRELQRTGVRPDRVEVIYGRTPKRLASENTALTTVPYEQMRDIVFVGQILENKGPHILIEAFRSLVQDHPDARLLIVGRISDWRGDDWGRDLRDGVAHDPLLGSRVIFLGFVENVPALLRGREVLVAPSLTEEPLGLVVLEAKAAAIPSIVFPSGGLPEMIEHGIDGFICRNKSVEALTGALKTYLENPSLATRQGAAALRSLDRLGALRFADRWLAVYEARV